MVQRKRRLNMLYRGKDNSRLVRESESAVEYKEIMDRGGPLKRSNKIQTKDIFLLALSFGYMGDVSIPINDEDKFLKAAQFGDMLPVLINAIALEENEGDISILSSEDSIIFKPSEEYANAGFQILKGKYVKNEEVFIEELRLKILKMNEDDYILKKLDELGI